MTTIDRQRLNWLKTKAYWQYLPLLFLPADIVKPLATILELYLQIISSSKEEMISLIKQHWWEEQITFLYDNDSNKIIDNLLLQEIKQINQAFDIKQYLWQNIVLSCTLQLSSPEDLALLAEKRQFSLLQIIAHLFENATEENSLLALKNLAFASAFSGYIYNNQSNHDSHMREIIKKQAWSYINITQKNIFSIKAPVLRQYCRYIILIAIYHLKAQPNDYKARTALIIKMLLCKIFKK